MATLRSFDGTQHTDSEVLRPDRFVSSFPISPTRRDRARRRPDTTAWPAGLPTGARCCRRPFNRFLASIGSDRSFASSRRHDGAALRLRHRSRPAASGPPGHPHVTVGGAVAIGHPREEPAPRRELRRSRRSGSASTIRSRRVTCSPPKNLRRLWLTAVASAQRLSPLRRPRIEAPARLSHRRRAAPNRRSGGGRTGDGVFR